MRLSLVLIIATGIAIGLALPGDPAPKPAAAAPTPARASRPAPPASETRRHFDTVLPREADGHFYASAEVNGQRLRLLVDTGASMVALTIADARRAGIPVEPERFTEIGRGASGPVRGQRIVIDRVVLEDKRIGPVEGAVVEGLEVSLLGQSFLSRLASVRIDAWEMRLN